MNHAKAKHIPVDEIPVIDIADLLEDEERVIERIAWEMQEAAERVGFFYVRNHGIPQALIDDVFRISREFYELPLAEKIKARVLEKKRGYIELLTGTMQYSTTTDLRESFLWGREFEQEVLNKFTDISLIGPNRWPDESLPEMKPLLCDYFERCVALGRSILRAFAVALDIEIDYFSSHFNHTISRGSSLYYPPQPAELGEEQFGIGAHTDWGVLTLLAQDEVGGLQVKGKDGEWLAAHPISRTLVVNVGDCLERWTNRRFFSNEHRVVNSSDVYRQSIVTFVDPDFDTDITPVVKEGEQAQYEPITCGEQVLHMFDKAYG